MNIRAGRKALQEGGLPTNTCCCCCHLEGLISSSPAAQVQVPPSSICSAPKRCAMLPDKWSCYGETTNGCLVYLLRSISLQMISLHNLKPRSLGSLPSHARRGQKGRAAEHRWSILRWRNLSSLRAKVDKKEERQEELREMGRWLEARGQRTEDRGHVR